MAPRSTAAAALGGIAILMLTLAVALRGCSASSPPSTSLASEADRMKEHVSRQLAAIAREQLGIDRIEDVLKTEGGQRREESDGDSGSALLQPLADRLQRKIRNYASVTRKNKHAAEEAHARLNRPSNSSDAAALDSPSFLSCCSSKPGLLQYDAQFGTAVNPALPCAIGAGLSGHESDAFVHDITNAFKSGLLSASPGIKWQYYVPLPERNEKGGGTTQLEYPAARLSTSTTCGLAGDTRHKTELFSSLHGDKRQFIVIVLDRGSSMTGQQVDLSRAIIRYVLSTISDRDYVGFVAAARDMYFPLAPECGERRGMVRATLDVRLQLSKFINVVQPGKEDTDHSAAFRAVADLVKNTPELQPTCNVQVLYASRGHLPSLESKENVFVSMADLLKSLPSSGQRLGVNVYALQTPSDLSEQFLRQVADQDYAVHNISLADAVALPIKGQFVPIESTRSLGATVGDYFVGTHGRPTPSGDEDRVSFTLPTWDPVGGGMVFGLSVPVRDRPGAGGVKYTAVTGIDVHLAELLEDFIYFGDASGTSYPVLLSVEDTSSKPSVIYHPLNFDDGRVETSPVGAEFGALEGLDGDTVERLLSAASLADNGKFKAQRARSNSTAVYYYRLIKPTNLLCLVVADESKAKDDLKPDRLLPPLRQTAASRAEPLLYHHLELNDRTGSGEKLCRHFRSLSTLKSGGLLLSPSAFISPFRHLTEDSPKTMPSYMAFLTDKTRLIANPGLREGIREDVGRVSRITSLFRSISTEPYVLRRYVALSNGVYFSYPAIVLPDNYNPVWQGWFRKAVRNPGKFVASMGLDPAGSGHIVSITVAVDDGRAVAGIDVSLGHVFNVLQTASSDHCNDEPLKCFLFDDEGYLISHPTMFDPTYIGPVDMQHINHKEPLIGKDLLDKTSLVSKRFCRSLPDGNSVRRFYVFDKDSDATVANSVSSGCYSYAVSPISGSNLFLGLVNATCPPSTIFCPCSVSDTKCIYCDQVEDEAEAADSCECPCQCPLAAAAASADLASINQCRKSSTYSSSKHDNVPYCTPSSADLPGEESFLHFPSVEEISDISGGLPECVERKCDLAASRESCMDIAGCSWCVVQLEVDPDLQSPSFLPLTSPHCAKQEVCFRGAEGAASPYSAYIRGKMLRERGPVGRGAVTSPIGSIAGGVMVFFLVMAVTVFCYRKGCSVGPAGNGWIFRRGSQANNDASVRIASIEMDEEEEMKEMNSFALQQQQQRHAAHVTSSAANLISPYRMSTGYRRPPPGTDSDHGYSTMTPMGTTVDSDVITPYLQSAPARERMAVRQRQQQQRRTATATGENSLQSMTSGMSSRASSPTRSLSQSSPPSAAPDAVAVMQHRPEKTALLSSEDEEMSSGQAAKSTLSDIDDLGQTVLGSNKIVVSATVHRVDAM